MQKMKYPALMTAGDLTEPATAARMLPDLQRELRRLHLAAESGAGALYCTPLLPAQTVRQLLGCKRVPAVDAPGAAVKLAKLQALQTAAKDLVAAAFEASATEVRVRILFQHFFEHRWYLQEQPDTQPNA